MTKEEYATINKHLTHEQLSNILYDTITKYEANDKARSIVAMLFWEYKKLRYTSDGYFHSDEEIENAYYTFKKAYKMLKDNK